MVENSQLLKGYQTKIIQINNQLQLVKGEKNSLAIEHERVKQLLAESNYQLQKKIVQLAEKQRLNKKLKVQKDQLDQVLQNSQRHRKILYDELYAEGQPQTYTSQSQRKVALLDNLSKIKNTFYSINIWQTQQIINQRNKEVTRISNLYKNLLKQHLKSQSEYYIKLQILKQQNFILKRKQNIRIDIQKQLQKSQKVNYQELQIRNKTLEQRVNLLIQKLKIHEETIRVLNKKLADKQIQAISINRHNMQNMPFPTPQIQQYLEMVQTNKILQKQLQQSNNRYEKLVMQFPNIISNQDQIIQILQKHKQLHRLQSEIQLKQIKNKGLVAQIQKYKQDIFKYIKQFNQKRSQYQNATEIHQSIIEKFKQFFFMVNPHYSTYQFDQLGLTEDQSKVVKKGKLNNQDGNLKKQFTILQDKFSKLQKALQIKNTELENVKAVLNKQNKKITELQAINTKINQGLQLKKIGSLQDNDQKCLKKALEVIAKLQDQRNHLKLQFRQQQIQIIQLKVQNSYYKDKKQLITYPQFQPTIQLDLNACRPHIVQIEIGKSFPQIQQKIVDLQKQIKKNSNQYQFLITQIKAAYQTQIATLKQKILKLEKIKAQQVINNQPIIQVINRQQSMHEQGQVNEVGSMLDLEQHMPFENGDEPFNTLNAQSIQQMNRLLNGHEVNLKNLIQAYSRLKQNYKRLKEHKQKNQYEQDINRFKKQIQKYESQIRLLKTRLVEADKNLISLEQQLNLKTAEIQSLKETLKRETQSLKKQIFELQKQNQSLKQQNWLQSPQITTISNKKAYFPQQIQYLIQLVLQKQEQVKSLKNQKQSAKKDKLQKVALQLFQNKNSKEYEQQERQIFQELIRSGSLLAVLEEANQKLKYNEKSDQI